MNKKRRKILLVSVLSALLLILLFITFIYLRPFKQTCLERDYYYSNDTYQSFLNSPSVRTCSSENTSVENVVYVNGYTEESNNVRIQYTQVNEAKSKGEEQTVLLPISLRNSSSELSISSNGYAKIYMNFETSILQYWLSSLYDLFGKTNTVNVQLLDWSISEIQSTAQDISISSVEKNSILEKSLDWFMTGGYQEDQHPTPYSYRHTLVNGDFNIKIQPIPNETELQTSVRRYANISNVFSILEEDLLSNVLEFIKQDYESISQKNVENQIEVDCKDVNTLSTNISNCGETCNTILSSMLQELDDRCNANTLYDGFLTKYQGKIEEGGSDKTFASISRIDTVVDLDEKDSWDSEKYNAYDDKRFWQRSDFVKNFTYWLYEQNDISNKSDIAYEAYVELLSYFKTRGFNYYGICDVGNTALDVYQYTNDERIKNDAKFIYTYGKILEMNTFPMGVEYMSGNVLKESLACANFLFEYSEIFSDNDAYANGLKIVRDRVDRSWATAGYPGGFGYDDEYKGTTMEDEIGGGFYDFVATDESHMYRYDFDNQAYLISLISKIK